MHVSRRFSTRGSVVSLIAVALGAVGLAGTASASVRPHANRSAVVGHVYVNDNTAVTNTVSGFARHADGALTALPGSPFTAGGTGTGAGLASQGAVQLADGGRTLLVVDAGSNQVSTLRVHRDGSLTETQSTPVSSGGADPVSIAAHGGLVYVANAGSADATYSGFHLSPSGALDPIAGSTVALPSNAQPGDLAFNALGSKLVGTRVGTSQIDSFFVERGGVLAAAPGTPYAAQGVGPFASAFSPTHPNELFVANAHNPATMSTVSSFIDLPDGTLWPLGGSPVSNGQTGSCWLVPSPNGRYIYTVNTGSGTVTSYAVARDGGLTTVASTLVPGAGAGNAVDLGISPNGRFLYVVESKTNAVAEFSVQGTQLNALASSPVALPAGTSAAGVAVQ